MSRAILYSNLGPIGRARPAPAGFRKIKSTIFSKGEESSAKAPALKTLVVSGPNGIASDWGGKIRGLVQKNLSCLKRDELFVVGCRDQIVSNRLIRIHGVLKN